MFQRDPHRGYIAERLSVVTKCLVGFMKEGERGGGVYFFFWKNGWSAANYRVFKIFCLPMFVRKISLISFMFFLSAKVGVR